MYICLPMGYTHSLGAIIPGAIIPGEHIHTGEHMYTGERIYTGEHLLFYFTSLQINIDICVFVLYIIL